MNTFARARRHGRSLAAQGIAVVGPVPAGLPQFELPSTTPADVVRLVPAALGIFVVSFADEILTARTFAGIGGVRGPPARGATGAVRRGPRFTLSG